MGSLWAKDVVEAWKSQEGYECGDNKWNKFADLLDRCDYFTGCGKKQNLDFCAIGLCWGVYVSVKYPDYEEDPESAKWSAHYFLYQSDNCDMAAVVKYLYQYFADNGAITDNPERGDIAIFQKSNGVMYHCGGVTAWDNDYIYITEFNTEGGKVKTHAYEYSDIGGKIKCFCRPRYDGWEEETVSEPEPEPEPTPEPIEDKKSVDELAQEVLDGKWGNGKDRYNRLTEAGYDYNEVQDRVNEILYGKKEEEPSAPSVVDYTVIAPHGLNIRENKPSNTDAPFHDNIPIITAMNYGDTFHCEQVDGLWNYGYYDCNGKTYYGWACGNNGIWLKKR